ncbi:MAG: hypothetical protein ACEY3D_06645 [Rickettsia sp.]
MDPVVKPRDDIVIFRHYDTQITITHTSNTNPHYRPVIMSGDYYIYTCYIHCYKSAK